MFLEIHSAVFTFWNWLDSLCVVIAFWISILESSNHFKAINSFDSYSELFCPNSVKYRFKNLFPKKSLTRSSTVIYSTN